MDSEPPLKAGCYCRISSDPKDKREGVDRQRDDTTALCEVKGWTPAGFYVDNDRSASNGKQRPEWDRMLADIKAGKIDAIAAWDQDRGWRMMSELETLRKFFTSVGREIRLATTGQGDIDLYSPTGVLAAQIKTAVSEHEVAMMKVRQRRAGRASADSGRPNWSRAFGYLDDTYRPDPVTAPLVQEAYTAVLAGASLKDVCRLFNAAEAFGLTGKPWTATTVSVFLRKPRNAGLREYHGEIVGQGAWDGLVSEELWRSVQAKLADPSRRKPGRKSVSKHLLTGAMRCGRDGCDGHLAGNWYSERSTGRYVLGYRCKACMRLNIRAEYVEPLLYRLVGGRLAMDDAEDLLKAEVDAAETANLREQLTGLYAEREQIGVERGQRLLTGQQAKTATDVINGEIAELERRQHCAERLAVLEDIPLGTPAAVDAVKQLSPDRFRAVIRLLGEVTVLPAIKGGKVFHPDRVVFDWH